MESILNNLQKIEDLRVVSRTSVEKYRNTSKTNPRDCQGVKCELCDGRKRSENR